MKKYIVESINGPFIPIESSCPKPSNNEVLVRIHASGVNPLDCKIRSGNAPHAQQPLPSVLGLDMAGVVEEVGENVTGFTPGDEVYGMVGGVGGRQGTLSEMIVVNENLLALKPKSLTMREAAALPLIAITAWEGIVDHAKVHDGQKVLIHAGTGGVGHIAVQLAKSFGAEVFATVSKKKEHIVESYGATPIDYNAYSTEEYVNLYTDGDGFDIVYDTVGGNTIDASFVAVKRYTGHVVSCLGWSTHSLAPLSFRSATYSGVFTLAPLLPGFHQEKNGAIFKKKHSEILQKISVLVDEGKVKPLLNAKRFTFKDIEAAYELVESGSLGKVVIEQE